MALTTLQVALISCGSAVFGALVTGTYTLRVKRNEYVNEYFKTVIRRRITAYEQLEGLIVDFRTAVVDSDDKPYHLPFSWENSNQKVFKLLFSVMSQGLWLSDEAFEKTRDLNYLLFPMPAGRGEAIDFGKQHYQAVAELREALEKILAADMINLHNVGRFLRQKRRSRSGFHSVQLYPTASNRV